MPFMFKDCGCWFDAETGQLAVVNPDCPLHAPTPEERAQYEAERAEYEQQLEQAEREWRRREEERQIRFQRQVPWRILLGAVVIGLVMQTC